MKPKKLNGLDVVFSTDVSHLMPAYEEIPEEFKKQFNPYVKLTSQWFYKGLEKTKLKVKPEVNEVNAFNHLFAILSSFEPSHEHKMAGVAYLMSQWFDITEEVEHGR